MPSALVYAPLQWQATSLPVIMRYFGAGEPSDQWFTGMSIVKGSYARYVPGGGARIGDPSKPAVQVATWLCAMKNMTCGRHGPFTSSFRYDYFESMNENEPGAGSVN